MPRNPPWTRDELILALDLYFRVDLPPSRERSRRVCESLDLDPSRVRRAFVLQLEFLQKISW